MDSHRDNVLRNDDDPSQLAPFYPRRRWTVWPLNYVEEAADDG